ncbi:nitroreductase, partial [Candidatus Poribacteria bacterium]|nr:nitroreductase [Candidatus Poribacteria bacterium]
MQFAEAVRGRRSIRSFEPRAIEDDKLTAILETVDAAPSAGNLQAYEVVVVKDANTRQALSRAALGQGQV